jgi:hypothetical protein
VTSKCYLNKFNYSFNLIHFNFRLSRLLQSEFIDFRRFFDVATSSMSLTTCLAICAATADPVQVAMVLESRCICAKGRFRFDGIMLAYQIQMLLR